MLKSIMLKEPKPKKLSEVAKMRAAYRADFLPWKEKTHGLLALPLPPNMANSRMHWRVKESARQEYFAQCDALNCSGLLPRPTAFFAGELPLCVEVEPIIFLIRLMDHDGATARIKWPLDWLVRNGYMIDDGPVNCELIMPHQMKAQKRGNPPRVEFLLRPYESN